MNIIVFDGYLAEVIKLRAERLGIEPDVYILSFFEKRCNAPSESANVATPFSHEVQCTPLST